MSPYAPNTKTSKTNNFFVLPTWMQEIRHAFLHPKKAKAQNNISMKWRHPKDNTKLGNFEAIALTLIIIINHIILNFSKTIISNTGSASALNILFVGILLLLFVELLLFLFKHFPKLDILDISEYLGGKTLKIITGILFIGYYIVLQVFY